MKRRGPGAAVRAAAGAAAVWAATIAGCAMGPDYKRPEIATPAVYRFESGANADSVADAGWWQVYQDPALQALIREGLANNLDVRIAAARVDQARAVVGSTRMQQLPQVAVTAQATRQRTSTYELPLGTPPVTDVFAAQGTLSYEIDFWGKYRRASEAARAQLLQSDYAKQDVMAALVASVATTYFTLQALDEQLAITRRTVETRQKFVDLTQGQHDRGTVSELDVATAQAQLAIAKATLPALKLQIGQTEDQMSVLLGHNPEAILHSDGTGRRRPLTARRRRCPPPACPRACSSAAPMYAKLNKIWWRQTRRWGSPKQIYFQASASPHSAAASAPRCHPCSAVPPAPGRWARMRCSRCSVRSGICMNWISPMRKNVRRCCSIKRACRRPSKRCRMRCWRASRMPKCRPRRKRRSMRSAAPIPSRWRAIASATLPTSM